MSAPLGSEDIFLPFSFSLGALLRARSHQTPRAGEGGHGWVHTAKPGAPGSYPGADNGEEEGTCPSSWWESASSVSQGFSPCATPHPWEHFSLLPASMGWGFIGISTAMVKTAVQLLHILFFNPPPAAVFLPVPHSDLLVLSSAVTSCQQDTDTGCRCVTSDPTPAPAWWGHHSPSL